MTLTATSQGQVAGYRPDIDGLRAVAILAVVAFHAFPAVVPGGFAGVDVFFVISGFLISRIMYSGLARKDFSLETFFAHRIKRIFPALILVLLASFGIGWFTLLPGEFAQLGKHIAAGAGFVQNIALWSEAGYFDVSSELKPLMHLWSLAVEEQFYLVYPVMVLAVWRAGKKPLALIAAIGVASFLLNIWRIGDDPTEAFFLSHTRLWELLAGALLACIGGLQLPRQGGALGHALSILGIALIGIAAFGLNQATVFPGWWALLPVAGAGLLIYAGPQACVNRWLLGCRGMVWVGLISYPLYLWHWPLLTFLRISELSPSSWQKLVAVGMAFVLAWLTYRLLEKPIRFGGHGGIKTAGLAACLAIVGGLGFVSYQFNGLPSRFPQEIRGVAAYVYDAKVGTRMPACWLEVDAVSDAYASECSEALRVPGGKHTVLVWGDSHAAGLYAGIQKHMGTKVAQFTRSACPPIMGVGSSRCVDVGAAAEGHRQVQLVADDLQRLGPRLPAHRAQAVQHGAADVGALGAQRHRLEHVLAGADAAVHVHLDRLPTASTISGSAEMEEGAPSSWRPPWLETISASAPELTARRASSTSWMPLRISLPPQRFLIHSTSAQDRRGSNCLAVHSDSEPMFSTPLTWPTMLPNWRRLRAQHAQAPARLGHQVEDVGEVSLGGADRPFFMSLWRWPRICRSSVSTSAEQPAALARSIRRFDEVAVAHHVQLEPERVASVPLATSSIEQMLMVDSVNGMPNFLAARAARISPSACCMPVRPVGAIATGMATGWPTMVVRSAAAFHVHRHPLAQQDLLEVGLVGAVGALGPRAGVGVVVEHARHPLLARTRRSSMLVITGMNKFWRAQIISIRAPGPGHAQQSFYQLPEAPPPLLEPPDELRLLELELELELLPDELLPPAAGADAAREETEQHRQPGHAPVGNQDSQSVRSRSGGFSNAT
jgi:peptidoglycan/LPS O-acetylase OafA/YrhL